MSPFHLDRDNLCFVYSPLEGGEEGPIYFEPPAKRQMNRKSLFLPNVSDRLVVLDSFIHSFIQEFESRFTASPQAEESNPVSPSSASFQLHSVEQRSIVSDVIPRSVTHTLNLLSFRHRPRHRVRNSVHRTRASRHN